MTDPNPQGEERGASVEALVCPECGLPCETDQKLANPAVTVYCLRHEDEDRKFRPEMIPTTFIEESALRERLAGELEARAEFAAGQGLAQIAEAHRSDARMVRRASIVRRGGSGLSEGVETERGTSTSPAPAGTVGSLAESEPPRED